MIDTKLKYFSVFYSKNANLSLSKRIKDFFDKNNSFTAYSQDIDEIILKYFSKIDFLVLDLTKDMLDYHSIMLLNKLAEIGFIKQIICIFASSENIPKDFTINEAIVDDENLVKNLEVIIKKHESKYVESDLYYDAKWVEVIADYLLSIGFSENQNGFMMIIDSLIYCLSKKDFSTNFKNNIYPYLASKYKVKRSAIEMRIRSSINCASKSEKFPLKTCPSIKQFTNYALTRIYGMVFSKGVITTVQVS